MTSQKNSAWDNFWRDTGTGAAYREQGPLQQGLAEFWTRFLLANMPAYERPRLLDLACGNGAVTQFIHDAAGHLGTVECSVHCTDYSPVAITEIARRFPAVAAVVSDARRTPFRDRYFEIVASQFGLEYAGNEAFAEAARLVAENGHLAAIVHLKDGAMYRENSSNRTAVAEVQASDVLGSFDNYVVAFFAMRRGVGRQAAVQLADNRLALSVKKLEQVLNTFGLDIVGGALYRLHSDLAHMYSNLDSFQPEDIRTWIKGNDLELKHYAGRMSSMLDASMDAASMRTALLEVEKRGIEICRQETMFIGEHREPAAWMIQCKRN